MASASTHQGVAAEVDADDTPPGVLEFDGVAHALRREARFHFAVERDDVRRALGRVPLDLVQDRLDVLSARHLRGLARYAAELDVRRFGEAVWLFGLEEVLEDPAGSAGERRGVGGEGVDGRKEVEEVMQLVEDDAALEFL